MLPLFRLHALCLFLLVHQTLQTMEPTDNTALNFKHMHIVPLDVQKHIATYLSDNCFNVEPYNYEKDDAKDIFNHLAHNKKYESPIINKATKEQTFLNTNTVLWEYDRDSLSLYRNLKFYNINKQHEKVLFNDNVTPFFSSLPCVLGPWQGLGSIKKDLDCVIMLPWGKTSYLISNNQLHTSFLEKINNNIKSIFNKTEKAHPFSNYYVEYIISAHPHKPYLISVDNLNGSINCIKIDEQGNLEKKSIYTLTVLEAGYVRARQLMKKGILKHEIISNGGGQSSIQCHFMPNNRLLTWFMNTNQVKIVDYKKGICLTQLEDDFSSYFAHHNNNLVINPKGSYIALHRPLYNYHNPSIILLKCIALKQKNSSLKMRHNYFITYNINTKKYVPLETTHLPWKHRSFYPVIWDGQTNNLTAQTLYDNGNYRPHDKIPWYQTGAWSNECQYSLHHDNESPIFDQLLEQAHTWLNGSDKNLNHIAALFGAMNSAFIPNKLKLLWASHYWNPIKDQPYKNNFFGYLHEQVKKAWITQTKDFIKNGTNKEQGLHLLGIINNTDIFPLFTQPIKKSGTVKQEKAIIKLVQKNDSMIIHHLAPDQTVASFTQQVWNRHIKNNWQSPECLWVVQNGQATQVLPSGMTQSFAMPRHNTNLTNEQMCHIISKLCTKHAIKLPAYFHFYAQQQLYRLHRPNIEFVHDNEEHIRFIKGKTKQLAQLSAS